MRYREIITESLSAKKLIVIITALVGLGIGGLNMWADYILEVKRSEAQLYRYMLKHWHSMEKDTEFVTEWQEKIDRVYSRLNYLYMNTARWAILNRKLSSDEWEKEFEELIWLKGELNKYKDIDV